VRSYYTNLVQFEKDKGGVQNVGFVKLPFIKPGARDDNSRFPQRQILEEQQVPLADNANNDKKQKVVLLTESNFQKLKAKQKNSRKLVAEHEVLLRNEKYLTNI
jgi:hypothetical protein